MDSQDEASRLEGPTYVESLKRPLDHTDRLTLALQRKIATLGPKALSMSDLLAVVIGARKRDEQTYREAVTLLRERGLKGLRSLPVDGWTKQSGLPRHHAYRLAAVFEIARRAYGRDETAERPRLIRPRDVYREVRDLAALKKEHLVGLYLDAQNGLIHRETISVGSLNTTRSHPREILYPAILHLALGFILAHNHPSGSLDPSDEDVAFSRAVQRAGETVGIELYDHIIVAGSSFTSLRERGAI